MESSVLIDQLIESSVKHGRLDDYPCVVFQAGLQAGELDVMTP